MGSVAAMRTLYKGLVEVLQTPEWVNSTQGDQAIFNQFLAAGRLSLDYRSRLFWATAFADPIHNSHIINTPYQIDDLVPHELYPPMLYQAQTGEVPVVVHFNHQKELMAEWWGKLWLNQLQGNADDRFRDIVLSRMEGAVVQFAGVGSKEWRDVCPKKFTGI